MNERAAHADRLHAAAPDDFAAERILKHDARSTVELVRLDEHRYVRKRYHVHPAKRIGYGLIGKLPAQREAANARRLAALGVRVPQPVEVIGQAVVMPYIEGPSLHDFLAACDDSTKRQAVARAVGEQMRRVIEAGLVNRDHKAHNLIIDAPCAERGAQPVLIDPMGLRRATPRRVARMIARLIETVRNAGAVSVPEMRACADALCGPDMPADEREAWRRRIDRAYREMTGERL